MKMHVFNFPILRNPEQRLLNEARNFESTKLGEYHLKAINVGDFTCEQLICNCVFFFRTESFLSHAGSTIISLLSYGKPMHYAEKRILIGSSSVVRSTVLRKIVPTSYFQRVAFLNHLTLQGREFLCFYRSQFLPSGLAYSS